MMFEGKHYIMYVYGGANLIEEKHFVCWIPADLEIDQSNENTQIRGHPHFYNVQEFVFAEMNRVPEFSLWLV